MAGIGVRGGGVGGGGRTMDKWQAMDKIFGKLTSAPPPKRNWSRTPMMAGEKIWVAVIFHNVDRNDACNLKLSSQLGLYIVFIVYRGHVSPLCFHSSHYPHKP